ncbi:MAG: CHRD domain-containing protein [Acidimicrobiia bacterium]
MRAQVILASAVLGFVSVVAPPVQAETKSYTATLSAAEEVPEPGPEGASGTARITVDMATDQLCYELTWSGMHDPEDGHIHKGPKGVAGPALIHLDPAKNGPKACIPVEAPLLQDLVMDPTNHYVNLHTHDHQLGAVRGQLSPS